MRDATARRYRLFERERDRRGQPDDLTLLTYDGVTEPLGYAETKVIHQGWFGKRVLRPTKGGEFFEFSIAEYAEEPTATSDISSVFENAISHLRMGNLYYQFKSVDQPDTATRVWVVSCEPTGQKAPAAS